MPSPLTSKKHNTTFLAALVSVPFQAGFLARDLAPECADDPEIASCVRGAAPVSMLVECGATSHFLRRVPEEPWSRETFVAYLWSAARVFQCPSACPPSAESCGLGEPQLHRRF